MLFSREVYLSMDTNWLEADSGLDKKVTSIYVLNSYYFTGHTAPQPVLAGTNSGLYQKGWAENFWTKSDIEGETSEPVIISIDVNPHWLFLQDPNAWAGGGGSYSTELYRSTDAGKSWKPISFHQPYDRSISSVAINTTSQLSPLSGVR